MIISTPVISFRVLVQRNECGSVESNGINSTPQANMQNEQPAQHYIAHPADSIRFSAVIFSGTSAKLFWAIVTLLGK
eukprot:scaffold239998_cov19-Prasinocladus_malaysianus.AAC.1